MSGLNPPRLEASSLFTEENKKDQIRCETYNTILAQVHNRIRATNKLPGNGQQLIYLVPEFIPGVPRFDMKQCIIYLAYNLRSTGFFVTYTHPNALYISWKEQARNYRINESPYIKTLIDVTEQAIKRQQSQREQLMIVNDTANEKKIKPAIRKTSEYKSIGGMGQYVTQDDSTCFLGAGDASTTKNVTFI
jgi:hypothetical protein